MRGSVSGVSPIISTVILISIVIVIAGLIGPWAYQISVTTTNQTGTQIDKELLCRNTGYDFSPSFGINGIDHDFSGPQVSDFLRAMIRNTGSVNIYGFSFQALVNDGQGGKTIWNLGVSEVTQKTEGDPLRPGESVILTAQVAQDIEGDLEKLTVLNGLDCLPISQDL